MIYHNGMMGEVCINLYRACNAYVRSDMKLRRTTLYYQIYFKTPLVFLKVEEVGRRLALDRQPYIHIRILSNVHNSYILLFQIIVSNKTLEYVGVCCKKIIY